MKNTLQFVFAFIICTSTSFAQDAIRDEISSFAAKTGAVPTIGKATNSVNFIRFPVARAMKLTGSSPQDKALFFLKQNAGIFKAKWDKEAYEIKEIRKDNHGLQHVALQQYVQGVPVFDGVLKFHFTGSTDLSSMNGNFISVPKLNTVPSLSMKEAAVAAIKHVTGQKFGQLSAPVKANKNTLYIFQKGLAQGYQGRIHLVYEVEVTNEKDLREFVYIDAHSGEIVEQFTGTHSIDRKLYEVSISSVNLKWQESNGTEGAAFEALDTWQKSEVASAGHIYNLMKNTFGQNSYDNAGATMVTINNNPDVNCPNANWNGRFASYCTGTASDDVVAHEWAHAYMEYTSGLIYAWQAGAMNESYSDIWGETVDQLNNYMDENESADSRTGCSSSARWQVGEKSTAFGGILRDMWNPNCEGDPGKVSDSQYWCSTVDNGGVHINSGILNHAYALLVDGGTYNGQSITGLGLTKAAHIFWRAQSHYMTSTTDFVTQADILEASLADLIGIDLPALSTRENFAGLSGERITAADAEQLAKVIAAVELRRANTCGFQKLLADVPTICSGALPENAIFFENFENGITNWTVTSAGSTQTWTPRNWVLKTGAPGGHSGSVVFGVDLNAGDCMSNVQNGLISIASPVITIPSGTSGPFNMAFDHYVATETGYDGGNIKYRINNGAWTLLPASAFTANGYNKVITANSGNPLQGQPGFSGTDEGSVGGSWGQSRIDLSKLGLTDGQTIQLRWDFGTDECGGLEGWYLDDIRVYSCASPSVQFVTTSSSVNEGEAVTESPYPNNCLKYIEKTIQILINKAPSQPVTVTLNATGAALQGATADYSFSPKSFVLQEGSLSQDVKVRIYDDAYVEEDESFTLTYTLSNAAGGDAYVELFNQSHKFTITDNDKVPTEVAMTLISEDFEDGMPDSWTVVGGGTYPSAWSVVQLPNVSLDPAKPKLLFINSDAAGAVTLNKVVESAPFNSVGMTSIKLSFLEYFYVWPSSFAEQGLVDVWDGTAWRNILTQTQETGTSGSWTSPAQRNILIPVAYANPLMKIRFRYIANYDFWWGIDNVKIIGESPKQIQSAISVSPDNQYLGPNSSAHFYDPASGNLLARISNLSDHDYGCTTVAIDRGGIDATNWQNANFITNKTFKVTPAYNNPVGSYEITLYYRSSELPNFNGSKIRSMGKSSNGMTAEVSGNLNYSKFLVNPVLDAGLAFTSTFNTGFSGFGMSDVSPMEGPLPVRLTSFEGKNTSEGNMLRWTTSSEVRHDYFEIESSADTKHFSGIGKVSGSGNSTESRLYQFLDNRFNGGITYYRLKQVDTDGTFAYSKIISVDAGNAQELKYFPNPVQTLLTMQLPEITSKKINIRIINAVGQQVFFKENVRIDQGKLTQDVQQLPIGMYQVVISGEVSVYNFSILKL